MDEEIKNFLLPPPQPKFQCCLWAAHLGPVDTRIKSWTQRKPYRVLIEFRYVLFNIEIWFVCFWMEEHVWICLGVPVRLKYSSCLTHWRRIPWVRVSELLQQTVWGFNMDSTWSWVEDGWKYWSDLSKKTITLTALFAIYTCDTDRCWTSLEMVVQQWPSQSKWKLHVDCWYDRKLEKNNSIKTVLVRIILSLCICIYLFMPLFINTKCMWVQKPLVQENHCLTPVEEKMDILVN